MDEYRYVYILMVGVAFFIWFIAFTSRKDLRKEMLVMTGIVGFFGIAELLYFGEYWTPSYFFPVFGTSLIGIEDFLLAGFLYGGIGSVIYQYISKQKYICTPQDRTINSLLTSNLFIIVGIITYFILENVTSLNVIYTTTIAMLVGVFIFITFNRHLLKAVLINGLLLGTLSIIVLAIFNGLFPGYIETIWNLDALSGILVIGVPIEEFLFHFAAGALFAQGYESLFNCKPLIRR